MTHHANPTSPASILNVRRLPGRLNAEQAAALIGVAPEIIPILTKAAHLKPLGKPDQQAVKYFCAHELLGLIEDRRWLDKVTACIYSHHREKTDRKKGRAAR